MNCKLQELINNAQTNDMFSDISKWGKRIIDWKGKIVAGYINLKYSFLKRRGGIKVKELMMRPCKTGWAYCNGDCKSCKKNNVSYSDRTTEK